MSINNEKYIHPATKISILLREHSNLQSLGFSESYRSSNDDCIIFNSQFCRVNFTWEGWDQQGGNIVHIYYGRLHAPNDDATMLWENEECYTWHRFEHVLHFLDGRSPAEAAEMDFLVPTLKKHYEAEYRKQYRFRQPEWSIKMHSEIWNSYGTKLFEVFDLRKPDLWEKYRQFLKDLYDIQGRPAYIDPPMDKIC
jgi:hypothetical protein